VLHCVSARKEDELSPHVFYWSMSFGPLSWVKLFFFLSIWSKHHLDYPNHATKNTRWQFIPLGVFVSHFLCQDEEISSWQIHQQIQNFFKTLESLQWLEATKGSLNWSNVARIYSLISSQIVQLKLMVFKHSNVHLSCTIVVSTFIFGYLKDCKSFIVFDSPVCEEISLCKGFDLLLECSC